MKIPCNSFKAISSATQIRSKIELYLKRINGGSIDLGPLSIVINNSYSKGLIDSEKRDTLISILVRCEEILFNTHEGDFIEFKEMMKWSAYIDSL